MTSDIELNRWRFPYDAKTNAEISRLELLEPNWDREGGKPIRPEIIAAARAVANQLDGTAPPPTRVEPSAEGTLQFVWDLGDRLLEVEFEDDSKIHYLKWHPRRGVEEEESFDNRELDRLLALIRWAVLESADDYPIPQDFS